jgi:predicted 3-demethylubiquinone-9 3-methyltransferase (glyoxalase superfamily)
VQGRITISTTRSRSSFCATTRPSSTATGALLKGGGKPQACGWLIDRFGLRWQIVPAVLDEMMRDKDPARSKRVTDALLKMVKLDIAAIEKAYRG